jgi:phosphatidylglycerophosphatase A
MLRHPAHFIALGAGSGLMRVAPGTAGTLVAFPLYALLAAAGTKRVRERIPEKLRRALEVGKPEKPLHQPHQLN